MARLTTIAEGVAHFDDGETLPVPAYVKVEEVPATKTHPLGWKLSVEGGKQRGLIVYGPMTFEKFGEVLAVLERSHRRATGMTSPRYGFAGV